MKHLFTQFHLIFANTLLGCYKILFILFFGIFIPGVGFSQSLDEWKNELINGNSNEKLEASWELFKYYRISDRDSALFYAELNNNIAAEVEDTLSMVKSFNALGYLYRENQKFTDAILFYKKGLDLAKSNDYSDQVKFLLNNIAIAYSSYGRYDQSLEFHFQSLKVREEEGDILGVSIAYNNIGVVYDKVGDDEKALKYFKLSLELKEGNNLEYDIERSLINISLAYSGLGQFDSALGVLERLFIRCQETECSDKIYLETYSSAGLAYLKTNDFINAELNFKNSLELSEKLQDDISAAIANLYLSQIKFNQNDIQSALAFLNQADEYITKTEAREWKMQIDNQYAEIYEALEDYKKAYFHENRYSTLKDSIFNEDLIKNLANIQLDYQEAQTQEIIAGKDTQIKRRTQINLMLGGITVLISALLFILYKNIQLKKKANRRLAEANDIIEHQNKELTNVNAVLEDRVKERTKELKKTNEALKKSNEELDNFIYKTSHDIRGPLATLMGVCNIAQIDVKDEKALDYFDKLSLTATRLNEILSKLLTINQINNTALQPQKIYVAELVENLAAEQIMNFKNPKIDIKVDIEDSLNLTSDLDLLRVIYGNLISNAIKFRDTSDRRDSFIKITAGKSNNFIEFIITDNGIGINETETEKIFEVFSKATDIADSSGIGLYLVKLAVEKLSGSISFEQSEEGNTVFKVILPA